MRSPSERRAIGTIQAAILDAVKASRPDRPPSDDEIGAVVKVDRSMCSLWRSGDRTLTVLHLVDVAGAYGGQVLQALLPGCAIVPEQRTGRVLTLRSSVAQLQREVAELGVLVHERRLTDQDAGELLRLVRSARGRLADLEPQVRRSA